MFSADATGRCSAAGRPGSICLWETVGQSEPSRRRLATSRVSLRCLRSGAHDAFDVLLLRLLGHAQIVLKLQAEPEVGRCAQVPR